MSYLVNKIIDYSIGLLLLVSIMFVFTFFMLYFASIWDEFYGKHNGNESVMLSCHSLLVGKTEVQQ